MTQYTLRLSFDLRQVTQTLAYEFVLPGNTGYAKEDGGPLAGTFNFQQTDDIVVEVLATSAANLGPNTGPEDILKDFAVTNCTFVSIPATMTEDLSLFDASSACSSVEDWKQIPPPPPKPNDNQKNLLRLCQRSNTPLPVAVKHGQWKISGYLSVELTTLDGKTHPQLYFFDPEGSSGNGGGGKHGGGG